MQGLLIWVARQIIDSQHLQETLAAPPPSPNLTWLNIYLVIMLILSTSLL